MTERKLSPPTVDGGGEEVPIANLGADELVTIQLEAIGSLLDQKTIHKNTRKELQLLKSVLESGFLLAPEVVARGVGCPDEIIKKIETLSIYTGKVGMTWLDAAAERWGLVHGWLKESHNNKWGTSNQEPSDDVADMTRTVLGIIEKSNLQVIDRWQVQRTCRWLDTRMSMLAGRTECQWLDTQASLLAGLAESQPTCEDPNAISEGER